MVQREVNDGDKFVLIREVTIINSSGLTATTTIPNGSLVTCFQKEPKIVPLIGFGPVVVPGLEVHHQWHGNILLPLDCLMSIETL
jgi:hypothetical protein